MHRQEWVSYKAAKLFKHGSRIPHKLPCLSFMTQCLLAAEQ